MNQSTTVKRWEATLCPSYPRARRTPCFNPQARGSSLDSGTTHIASSVPFRSTHDSRLMVFIPALYHSFDPESRRHRRRFHRSLAVCGESYDRHSPWQHGCSRRVSKRVLLAVLRLLAAGESLPEGTPARYAMCGALLTEDPAVDPSLVADIPNELRPTHRRYSLGLCHVQCRMVHFQHRPRVSAPCSTAYAEDRPCLGNHRTHCRCHCSSRCGAVDPPSPPQVSAQSPLQGFP